MCLANAGILRSVEGVEGMVDYGGLCKKADLTLTPQVKEGDRVLVHAGFSIAVLEKEEGDELMQLLAETRRYG